MGKYIGRIYKNGKSQLTTPSIKTPVILYLDSQTCSYIELTRTSAPFGRDIKQTNSVLCSQNSIQNDVSITNNYYI